MELVEPRKLAARPQAEARFKLLRPAERHKLPAARAAVEAQIRAQCLERAGPLRQGAHRLEAGLKLLEAF